MLRYKSKLDLVWSPCTTCGQETERVYSYNPRARTGQPSRKWIEKREKEKQNSGGSRSNAHFLSRSSGSGKRLLKLCVHHGDIEVNWNTVEQICSRTVILVFLSLLQARNCGNWHVRTLTETIFNVILCLSQDFSKNSKRKTLKWNAKHDSHSKIVRPISIPRAWPSEPKIIATSACL